MENPLGIMYVARSHDGSVGVGFVAFRAQDPGADHSDEWSEILGEIAERELVPLSMAERHQSDWLKLAMSKQ